MKIYIILLLTTLSISNGYKILFLVPFSGPSHWLSLQYFVKELVYRGHEVTAVVNAPITNFKSNFRSNYSEILIVPPLDLKKIIIADDVFKSVYQNDFAHLERYTQVTLASSKHALNDMNVQKLIHSKDLHFDLVINEEFCHEAWLMFAYKFNAPVITISINGYWDFFDRAMGLLTPWSHIAHTFLSHADSMSYWERVYNVILCSYNWYHRNIYHLPEQNKITREYFYHLAQNGKQLPTVEELYQNISMILVNTHKTVSVPRPKMSGIVNIEGAHINPPKPLPEDLKQFIENSKHGVVFFTLGSFMKSSEMPQVKIDAFLEAFGQLKQNVIWKFESRSIANLPENILIRDWLPQSDILAHENVVLFVTHGGLGGRSEGIACGVPMLFIPLFGDQHRNAREIVEAGHGMELPFSDVTATSLSSHLNEMLTNKTYYNRAKEVSNIFNDYLVHPMDEAMYWIEYVARHKGATHLKSNAVNMSWFSYLLLDIVLVVPFFAILLAYMIYILMQIVKRKLYDYFVRFTIKSNDTRTKEGLDKTEATNKRSAAMCKKLR